jgi:hypothetical protein
MFVYLRGCALLRLCYFHILPEYRAIRDHANNALNYFPTIRNNNVVGAQMCDVVATPVPPTLRSKNCVIYYTLTK